MDVTQPLLRPGGSARTRLLVDDRVVVVDALNGTEPVARATPAYGDNRHNLGRRRPTPHSLPLAAAEDETPLLGRESDIAAVEAALAAGETAVLAAGAGHGKTTLLRHLAHRLAGDVDAVPSTPAYRDGAVLLSARGRTIEDVLFEVFRACYEVPGRRPGPEDLRRHLTHLKALILVDDVAEPARLATALADYAPYCRVVLATETEPAGHDGFAEVVAGFGVEADGTLASDVPAEEWAEDDEPAEDHEPSGRLNEDDEDDVILDGDDDAIPSDGDDDDGDLDASAEDDDDEDELTEPEGRSGEDE